MTPLSDALTAAQAKAVASLSKAYVAGAFEDDGDSGLLAQLERIGLNDPVDAGYLRECLDVLRVYGGTLPTANGARPEDAKATDAQRARIRRDLQKLNRSAEEVDAVASEPTLTKAKASALIEAIAESRYDPAEWVIPF